MSPQKTRLFLRTLKEDGIEMVHLPKRGQADFLLSKKSACPPPDPSIKGTGTPESRGSQSPTHEAHRALCELRAKVESCKLCAELARTRNKVVFGSGSASAKLVFVGEAPGADENEQGLPFVGRAGQLLTKIIEAMGLTRDQVFICNVLKCRPPGNRPPAPQEVENCRPFLKRQLEILKPQVIVALGNHAVKALLGTEQGITGLRGTFQKYEGIPVMCTYHPAYLLRSPGEKRKVWEDMKKVMKFLEGKGE
jgi:DNA polymerase